jgi:hypothetical protein
VRKLRISGLLHGLDMQSAFNWKQQAQVIICKTGASSWTLNAHISFANVFTGDVQYQGFGARSTTQVWPLS